MTSPPADGPMTAATWNMIVLRPMRVRQVFARHEVGHERLARRPVERSGRGAQRRQHVDRPRALQAAQRRGLASTPARTAMALCVDDHHPAPVVDVGRHPADQREHDDRHDPDEADEAERQAPLAGFDQQRHVPQDARRLHHRAGERHDLAEPEQAEVAVLQGEEGGGGVHLRGMGRGAWGMGAASSHQEPGTRGRSSCNPKPHVPSPMSLVPVVLRLVRAVHRHAEIVGLLPCVSRVRPHAEVRQVQPRHLFVEVLRQHVDLLVVLPRCARAARAARAPGS